MKSIGSILVAVLVVTLLAGNSMASFLGDSLKFWAPKTKILTPKDGQLTIPIADISDGAAHHFNVLAADGTMVTFFTLKSSDGVIRAAIDACDVCYRAGKGYAQDGEYMVCLNCGQKFHSSKINVIRGGCNPAPLERKVVGDHLVIGMRDVNNNSWYCRY